VRAHANSGTIGGVSEHRSQLAARAWAALLQAHANLVPRLDRDLQQATGLPLSWYDVLLELAAAADRRLTMSELGERAVLSRTRVSRIVTELEAAGLVYREGNPDDGRSAFAVMTAEGLTRYRAAVPRYLESIETHFAARLTDAELDSVATALGKVAQQTIALTPARSLPARHLARPGPPPA
jgi:DNA-binding MarR family transcriptional regulator